MNVTTKGQSGEKIKKGKVFLSTHAAFSGPRQSVGEEDER